MLPMLHTLLFIPMVTLAATTASSSPCPPDCSNEAHGHAAVLTESEPVATNVVHAFFTGEEEVDEEITLNGKSIFNITMIDGAETINIEHDGKTMSAVVNGKAVPADRVRMNDGRVEVLDARGKILHSIPVSIGRAAAILDGDFDFDGDFEFDRFTFDDNEMGALKRRFGGAMDQLRVLQGGELPEGLLQLDNMGDGVLRAFVRGDDNNVRWDIGEDASPPNAMIGVHLEAPGDVLCAQLGLDADSATVISGVLAGLPAAKGGLKPFDIIVAVDGEGAVGIQRVRSLLGAANPGDRVAVEVVRGGERVLVNVRPAAYDSAALSAADVKGRVAGTSSGREVGLFPQAADQRIFFAPGEEGGNFRVFERPNTRELRLPMDAGTIQLKLDDSNQLRELADSLGRELRVELREVLPEMLQETDRGIEEIRRGMRLAEPIIDGVLGQVEGMVEDPETVARIQIMIEEALGEAADGLHEAIIDLDEHMPSGLREVIETEMENLPKVIGRANEAQAVEREAVVREAVERARRAGADARKIEGSMRPVRVPAAVEGGRTRDLERRMERIEAMLERLMQRLDRSE
ncbi:MAG: PDZ domain-containing protein [Phycisphaerales bacterium]